MRTIPYACIVYLSALAHVCMGGDFTRGFDTQNYPKLQAHLGTQPENTHRIQRQPQPIPVDFFA